MLLDLSITSPNKVIKSDVCIVGAGAAGIFLASRLVKKGHSVVLIDAGPSSPINTESIGFQPIFTKDEYSGALAGRYFGLGGSTSNWGGNLVPHINLDCKDDYHALVWDTIARCVEDHSSKVLRHIGYQKDPSFHRYALKVLGVLGKSLENNGIYIQSSLLLPFHIKNFIGLLSDHRSARSKLTIISNAVARDWSFCSSENRKVKRLTSVSINKNKAIVDAHKYVIAAGAIESARILLEIDKSTMGEILPRDAEIGAFLGDHLSIPVADVSMKDSSKVSKLFGLRFDGSWMRGIRFLDKDMGCDSVRAFYHFEFDNQSPGFIVAREVLKAIQLRESPKISFRTILSGLKDLCIMAYYRFFYSKLYVPKDTMAYLQLDVEQIPSRENKISLSKEIDAYQRKKIEINWKISSQDMDRIYKTTKRFLELWSSSKDAPVLIPRKIDFGLGKPYDAYHPVGTCQMGIGKGAVVDLDLKVHGIDNLWVLSTGVLPSAGSANPTFSMLCLGNRLVEQWN